ncbi:MAG: SIS domain-containing protein [Candidatus Omnitrophica bacterium]|nr:SIS domain-containing protein [Candidatus Omnitrophota bacterium]
MNTLEKFFSENKDEVAFYDGYANYLSHLVKSLDKKAVRNVAECFLKAREENRTIYFVGNGGSATTAMHFAQDVGEIGRKIGGKGFRTKSIVDNVSALTAIGNDYDYSQVFSLQIQYCFDPGDVLVLISASGNSPNVIKAAQLAKEKGGVTVALVGFCGGQLAKMCDHVVHVESIKGEYGPVEDVHLVLNHMITSYLMLSLKA